MHRVPWGPDRRNFRVLADKLGFYLKVVLLEPASPLVRVRVYKQYYFKRDISFPEEPVPMPALDSVAAELCKAEWNSAHKMFVLPPNWTAIAVDAVNHQGLDFGRNLATVLESMKSFDASPMWGLEWLRVFMKLDPQTKDIPVSIFESLIEMCSVRNDVFGLIEVLLIVRERGIKLPQQSWNESLGIAWRARRTVISMETWERLFVEVRLCRVASSLHFPNIIYLTFAADYGYTEAVRREIEPGGRSAFDEISVREER